MISYKSYSDLVDLVLTSRKLSTRNYDLVLGVPKSGLIPALVISSSKNIPLGDTALILSGGLTGSGSTTTTKKKTVNFMKPLEVLLIDDSYHSGSSMAQARERIRNRYPHWSINCFAVYASCKPRGDIAYLEMLHPPHVFQWNLFKNTILQESCCDIDGVLCNDPEFDEILAPSDYNNYLSTAPLKNFPFGAIKAIVSGRRRSFEAVTSSWLAANNIQYQSLHLFPEGKKKNQQSIAEHKARIYDKSKCRLFIESNDFEARLIHFYSKKPVYCVDSCILYQSSNSFIYNSKSLLNKHFFKRNFSRYFPELIKKHVRQFLS